MLVQEGHTILLVRAGCELTLAEVKNYHVVCVDVLCFEGHYKLFVCKVVVGGIYTTRDVEVGVPDLQS